MAESDQFTEVGKLKDTLRESLEMADKRQEDISRQDILTRIQTIVISVSKGEAPVLRLMVRDSWASVRFHKSVGLALKADVSMTAFQCDCPSSATRFGTYTIMIHSCLDSVVHDVSCILKVPHRSLHVLAISKGFISGDLCYLEEDGTKVDCNSSSTAVPVSSNVNGIRNIVSAAKFILIVKKDATFQRLLDDDFCTRLSPCIIITGKGMPDVNSRLMVRKLWDTLHIPVFALVDADPYGIEIMYIYKYGSWSMAFEAHSLTVPSVLWLGLLPSDIQRYRVPEEAIIPFSQSDERKTNSLRNRAYITCQPAWEREVETMHLPNKLRWRLDMSICCPLLDYIYMLHRVLHELHD